MTRVFLHGLDSSSKGTKGKWFRDRFPEMIIPDFTGSLDTRLKIFEQVVAGLDELVLTGSSFGGLMAAIFALENESRVKKVILLAPALNFPDFSSFSCRSLPVPAILYIGSRDTVCPPEIVIPAAKNVFADLSVFVSDDDHLLHDTFTSIDWKEVLKV